MREDFCKAMMWAGSAASVILEWMNSNAASLGVLIAMAGLLMNGYYQRKRTRIAQQVADQASGSPVKAEALLAAVARTEGE